MKHWIAAVLKQNAPECILFPFPPLTPATGDSAPDTRGGEGREGKGKGRGGKVEGKGRGSLRHCRWGIDARGQTDTSYRYARATDGVGEGKQ